jgi:hypothetical protein
MADNEPTVSADDASLANYEIERKLTSLLLEGVPPEQHELVRDTIRWTRYDWDDLRNGESRVVRTPLCDLTLAPLAYALLNSLKFEGAPADEPAGPITQNRLRFMLEFAHALVEDEGDNGKCETVWISSPLVTPIESYVYVVAKRQPDRVHNNAFGCMVLDRLATTENYRDVPEYKYIGWHNNHGNAWQWGGFPLEDLFNHVHDFENLLDHWD